MSDRIFIKNGFYCTLQKDIGESYEQFMERGYFIVSLKPADKNDYDKYVIYSRIRNNMKYHGCMYSKEIEDIIRTLSTRI